MITLPNKDTLEVLDYPIRWGQWLPTGSALSATASHCTAALEGLSTPGGLTDLVIDSTVVSGTDFIMWLSGGTNGETYTLKTQIKDNQSPQRTAIRRFQLTMALK